MSVTVNIAKIPVGLERYINGTVTLVMDRFKDTSCGEWVYAVAKDVYWQLDDDIENMGMTLNIFAEFENEMQAIYFRMNYGTITTI